MSDLIDRQAAIAVADSSDYVGLPVDDVKRVTDEVVKGLTRLLSAQPGEWIPCSERLPKYDGEMYLVTDYCEQINRRRLHISYCYVNREGFWSDVPLGYKVVAWMPLPEPYKE